jgi:hypothetical protein
MPVLNWLKKRAMYVITSIPSMDKPKGTPLIYLVSPMAINPRTSKVKIPMVGKLNSRFR